jgi:hypothetical protein
MEPPVEGAVGPGRRVCEQRQAVVVAVGGRRYSRCRLRKRRNEQPDNKPTPDIAPALFA